MLGAFIIFCLDILHVRKYILRKRMEKKMKIPGQSPKWLREYEFIYPLIPPVHLFFFIVIKPLFNARYLLLFFLPTSIFVAEIIIIRFSASSFLFFFHTSCILRDSSRLRIVTESVRDELGDVENEDTDRIRDDLINS